jgi:hypothetical protein
MRLACFGLLVCSLAACGGKTSFGRSPDGASGGSGGSSDASASSGGSSNTGGSSGGTSNGGASADAASVSRIPAKHRAVGDSCPMERGEGLGAAVAGSCANQPQFISCRGDSDCADGTNGRCMTGGPIGCMTNCSYDACASDSDCLDNVPCQCRASASDSEANTCASASNCRIDSDCGPGGFCSPSVVDNFCDCPSTALCGPDVHCWAGNTPVPCSCGDGCGHGYYCHTPNDTCLDDSDCVGQGTCNYDRLNNLWFCAICWPVI